MFTSKLYVPQSSPSGGAEILLDLPRQGSGLCQFSIQRGGQTNHILGPHGWQSSDYWFELECQTFQGKTACVYVGPELVKMLTFSNYRIAAKWRDEAEITQTILRGGDVVPHPIQGAKASTIRNSDVPENQVGRLPSSPQLMALRKVKAEEPATVPVELPSLRERQVQVPGLSPGPVVGSSARPAWLLPGVALLIVAALGGWWFMTQKMAVEPSSEKPDLSTSENKADPVPSMGGSQGQADASAKSGPSPDTRGAPSQGLGKSAGIGPNTVTDKSYGASVQTGAEDRGTKPSPSSSPPTNPSGSAGTAPALPSSPPTNPSGSAGTAPALPSSPPTNPSGSASTAPALPSSPPTNPSGSASTAPPKASSPDLNRLVIDAIKK